MTKKIELARKLVSILENNSIKTGCKPKGFAPEHKNGLIRSFNQGYTKKMLNDLVVNTTVI